MICRHCGHENPDSNSFCEHCGVKLSAPEDMQGSSPVDDGKSFQAHQGKAAKAFSLAGAASGSGAVGKGKLSRKRKAILIIAIAAVVLAAAAGVFAYANHKNLEEYNSEVDKAKEYMESKDYEKAEARERMEIRFVKVKGHAGDAYNGRADALARSAVSVK